MRKIKFKFRKPDIETSKNLAGKKKALLAALAIIALIALGAHLGYAKYQQHTKGLLIEQSMKDRYKRYFKAERIDIEDEETHTAYLSVDKKDDYLVKVKSENSGVKISDNYVGVRLSHEITDAVRMIMPDDEYLFIKADNTLEYTDAGEKDANTVTLPEYLAEHEEDRFDIYILVDKDVKDPKDLRNIIGSRAYSLDYSKGYLNMYGVDSEKFKEIRETATKWDSMKREEIKEALKDADPMLSLSFSEINPAPEENKGVESHVKDQDNSKKRGQQQKQ